MTSTDLSTPTRPLATIARVVRACLIAVVAFLVVGNLAIVGAWRLEARSFETGSVTVADVSNFQVVDARLWRGAAPSGDSFRDMAAKGVTTVIDLRAEDDLNVDTELVARLGLERIAIPMRDGQAPSDAQVARFLDAVEGAEGTVFVHCGAGVGRTGTMVAAYRVATGGTTGLSAMERNLAVGPPSLEQLAFAASLDGGLFRPTPAVVAASRLLDAPRRIWTRLRA